MHRARTTPALTLLMLLVAGGCQAYFPKEPEEYRSAQQGSSGALQDPRRTLPADLDDYASLATLLRELIQKDPAVTKYQERSGTVSKTRYGDLPAELAQSIVSKRGVMMGVDLPDFILNRNQQSMKHLQALRQRLFEGGRRR